MSKDAYIAIAIIGWALFAVTAFSSISVFVPHIGKVEGEIDYLVTHAGPPR